MKVIIAKYKSDVVRYLQEQSILREDAQIVLRKENLIGLQVTDKKDIIILDDLPWYGFDEKRVIRELVVRGKSTPVEEVKEIRETPLSEEEATGSLESALKEAAKPKTKPKAKPNVPVDRGGKPLKAKTKGRPKTKK